MSWIKVIGVPESTGKLKKLYHRVSGPDSNVDNIMMAHSLRPHTMEGHMALYKNVLHHTANTLEKHWLEAIGVYVSILNQCHYCIEHHFQGYMRLIQNDVKANEVRECMENETLSKVFSDHELILFQYVKMLTLMPAQVNQGLVTELKNAGYDDGQILEINQVAAYFNYANRTVLGLGVSLEGDIVGLSPNNSSEPDNWQHQ